MTFFDATPSTSVSSSYLSDLYVEVMRQVWSHPLNDQRPSVLEWLAQLRLGFTNRIVDIGAGDAYYLSQLRPREYSFVEPNSALHQTALAHAAALRIKSQGFFSIKDIISSDVVEKADLVLIIHALLYLDIDEIESLLPKLRRKLLLLAYPFAARSTTIQFEKLIGKSPSMQKIKLKARLLGRPTTQRVADTHLYLPPSADVDCLAFLIAHRVLNGTGDKEKMILARKFLTRRLGVWKCPAGFKIPQTQILEMFSG
jgi:hypothetical protein